MGYMRKNIYLILFGFLSIGFIIITSIGKAGSKSKQFIWVEAEDAEKVTWPMEIQESEDAIGKKCIVVLPGSHGKSTGHAKYSVHLPRESEYVFWGRCNWPNECSDEFKVSLDGSDPVIFGDHIMREWHWVRGPSQVMTGKCDLKIINFWDNTKLDRFLLTSDLNYKPIGDGSSQDYIIDFENKQMVDFSFSQPHKWKIDKETSGNHSLFMTQTDDKAMEYGLLPNSMPVSLVFKSLIEIDQQKAEGADAIFIFDLIDQLNYCYIKYENDYFSHYQIKKGEKRKLCSVYMPDVFDYGTKNDITIYKNDSMLKLKSNGELIFEARDIESNGGKIGIGSESGNIQFDDIITISDYKPFYHMNFHGQLKYYEFRIENTPFYLENIKYSRNPWWKVNGYWNKIGFMSGVEPFLGKRINDEQALVVFGEDFWESYSIKMAIRTTDNSGMGIAFCLQDTSNYYLFDLHKSKGRLWKHQLLRVSGGTSTVLCDIEKEHQNEIWSRLDIKLKDDTIAIYKDKELLMKKIDTTFSDGKVGLVSKSEVGAYFDDIYISPTKTAKLINNNPERYTFAINEKISLDLSDWMYPKDKMTDAPVGFQFRKDLFEEVHLTYKEKLKGNFVVNYTAPELIKGIYRDYVLKCYRGKTYHKYYFQIADNRVRLKKDDKKVLEKKISCHRNLVSIQVADNQWKLLEESNVLISGLIENAIDSIEFSLGYSGVGKDHLHVGEITIEKDIKEN